jgi:hypothetical protein
VLTVDIATPATEPEEPPVTQKRLTNLADVLRKAGLTVVEVDGWKTRSRPESSGGFNPVGVLWHHTGSFDGASDARNDRDYAKWLASVGRSDLPAPLCQLSISAEGVVYVCAAGRANHAGKAKASGTVAAGDGNSLYVGVECMNSGKQGWPKPQYDAMVKTGVALAKMLGSSAQAQRAHKETSTTGKWDPGMLNMDKFRADIAAGLKPAAKPQPTPNITAALRAKTQADRLKALDLVIARSSNPVAVAAAKAWRASITRATKARADLTKQERK